MHALHRSLLQGQDTASVVFSVCPHISLAELACWLKTVWHKVRKKIAFLGKIITDFVTTEADIANVASIARVASEAFKLLPLQVIILRYTHLVSSSSSIGSWAE